MIRHFQILFWIFIMLSFSLEGQEKTYNNSLNNCENLLNDGYISDGQVYLANFNSNNNAEFHTTFYGGSMYRIIACSDIKDHKLIINIFDTEKNLLYSNINYDYIPFWNFSFTSTVECVIVIKVDAKETIKKPVKLLIGFKEKEHSKRKP